MNKILVLFVFHIYNDRVKNFINNAIFYDENIDFIIISNNKNISFKVPDYVKCLFRDNIGYDFGGWSDALLIDNLYKKYDKFIFVNSSVIGPFLSPEYKGKWPDIYIDGLQENIKLFGSTINIMTSNKIISYKKFYGNSINIFKDPADLTHVQSYIFSMDKTTLEYLISSEIFSITNYTKTYMDTILYREILMSRKIIEYGWNIGSLMSCYKDVDFTFKDKKLIDYNLQINKRMISHLKVFVGKCVSMVLSAK